MKQENVKLAIKMMERVRDEKLNFNLKVFHTNQYHKIVESVYEAQQTDTTCGVSGWLALDENILMQGYKQDKNIGSLVSPVAGFSSARASLAEFLGISLSTAQSILFNRFYNHGMNSFYGKESRDVTAQDVVDKLNLILKGELQ